ncbi:MAG: hypothetical protein ABWZ19_10030 [Hyphomicrobium sp.]
MARLHIGFHRYYSGGDIAHRHEAPCLMTSIPHPKRELLRLCARIGYTPH